MQTIEWDIRFSPFFFEKNFYTEYAFRCNSAKTYSIIELQPDI